MHADLPSMWDMDGWVRRLVQQQRLLLTRMDWRIMIQERGEVEAAAATLHQHARSQLLQLADRMHRATAFSRSPRVLRMRK